MIDCALFQPDIPQNAGAMLRLGACLGAGIHIIHPAGFSLRDRFLRRAGLDYLELASLQEHADWSSFVAWAKAAERRIVALTTAGETPLHGFSFRDGDVLLFGRESAGLPQAVKQAAAARLRIPVRPPARSLNIAVSAGIALAEALRQTGGLPP